MGLIVSTLRNCCLGREAPLELWTAQQSPLGNGIEKKRKLCGRHGIKKKEKHYNYENCVEDTETKK